MNQPHKNRQSSASDDPSSKQEPAVEEAEEVAPHIRVEVAFNRPESDTPVTQFVTIPLASLGVRPQPSQVMAGDGFVPLRAKTRFGELGLSVQVSIDYARSVEDEPPFVDQLTTRLILVAVATDVPAVEGAPRGHVAVLAELQEQMTPSDVEALSGFEYLVLDGAIEGVPFSLLLMRLLPNEDDESAGSDQPGDQTTVH